MFMINKFLTTYITMFSIIFLFVASFIVNKKNEFCATLSNSSLEELMWFIFTSNTFLIWIVCVGSAIMLIIIAELLNKSLINQNQKENLLLLYVFAIINSAAYEIYNVLTTVYSNYLKFNDTLFQNKLFKITRIWDPEHLSTIIKDAFSKQDIEVPLNIVRAIVDKFRSAEKSIDEVTMFLLKQEQAAAIRARRMAAFKNKHDPYGVVEFFNSSCDWVSNNASTLVLATIGVAIVVTAVYLGFKTYTPDINFVPDINLSHIEEILDNHEAAIDSLREHLNHLASKDVSYVFKLAQRSSDNILELNKLLISVISELSEPIVVEDGVIQILSPEMILSFRADSPLLYDALLKFTETVT